MCFKQVASRDVKELVLIVEISCGRRSRKKSRLKGRLLDTQSMRLMHLHIVYFSTIDMAMSTHGAGFVQSHKILWCEVRSRPPRTGRIDLWQSLQERERSYGQRQEGIAPFLNVARD